MAHSIEVPSEIIRKWQEFVNLLAEIMHVPSASIMRADPPHIKVFVSSTSKGNPCEPGALDTGPYCETVMKTGQPLLVPDALENEAWKANPHVRLGMISYLGVPIGWPDGRLFGTICVRDNKRNEYSEAYLKLLLHFRDMLQADLNSLVRLHGEIEEREAISGVLRAIASSPHDLQPIFDAILDSATRLCRADAGTLRLSEESGFRLMAVRGAPLLEWSSSALLAKKGSLLSRVAASRLPTHIPDLTAHQGDLRDDVWITAVNAGFRTALVVPLLKDNEIVGTITLSRKQVRPFTDKQISLFTDFAAQATIALESVRRERQYREAQSELAHANRVETMGQLTASIAHEIKQPIATARNNARAALNFLGMHPPDLSEVKEALDCIVADADRAGDIVDRIGSCIKKAPPRKEVVDLNAAILEVTDLTHGEAVKTGVTVSTQLAGELPRIQYDRVQLQQVMMNLIVNAIQSMSGVEDGNRELHISSVSSEPEGVCVAVRDTGHGLRPEGLPRLFEPFYTTKPDGMGMGLSICRSIIENHGGRLWATSCEPRGAVFQFTIPAELSRHL